jgi:hypothetical protein
MSDKGKVVEIPKQGSLGILAHGDIGIEAWRKVRGPVKEPQEKSANQKDKK